MEFLVPSWMEATSDNRVRLLAQRCGACGTVYFPKTALCKRCSSRDVVEVRIGPEAELHSYTIDRMGGFLKRPHLVGNVRFPEGAFIQGYIDGSIEETPVIGSTVDLVPFEVEVKGEPGLTYAFRTRKD